MLRTACTVKPATSRTPRKTSSGSRRKAAADRIIRICNYFQSHSNADLQTARHFTVARYFFVKKTYITIFNRHNKAWFALQQHFHKNYYQKVSHKHFQQLQFPLINISSLPMNANVAPVVPIDTQLQQAIAEHQAGRYAEAEELYLSILQIQPYHAIANHNMGLLAGQVGQFQAGLPYLHKALSVNPDEGQFWLSYADGLLQAGEREQALEIVTEAITRGLDNDQSQALRARVEAAIAATPTQQEIQAAIELYQAGRHAELEVASRALTEKYPASDFAWSVLGTALQVQGKDAFAALQKLWNWHPMTLRPMTIWAL